MLLIWGGLIALTISTLAFTGDGLFEDFLDTGIGLTILFVTVKIFFEIEKLTDSNDIVMVFLLLIKMSLIIFFVIGIIITIQAIFPDYLGKIKNGLGSLIGKRGKI